MTTLSKFVLTKLKAVVLIEPNINNSPYAMSASLVILFYYIAFSKDKRKLK